MPLRAPIDPTGCYHVSSRSSYGRALFPFEDAHEQFLAMYARVAEKKRWQTLAWVLLHNHHHMVVQLSDGGLSEGLRELHGGYARWFHKQSGETRQGHLFRHAFFARELPTAVDALVACCYVDLNPVAHLARGAPEIGMWCGYRATIGLEPAQAFHNPSALLDFIDPDSDRARAAYRRYVHDRLAEIRRAASPNEGVGVVESAA